MITSCDPINPYTESKTFGVPYNGGYKPDPTLEWIPADTNVVDSSDDIVMRPNALEPANTYLKTCEARRQDPRLGIASYQLEYDDFTEVGPLEPAVPAPPMNAVSEKDEDIQWKIMLLIAIVILLFLVFRCK